MLFEGRKARPSPIPILVACALVLGGCRSGQETGAPDDIVVPEPVLPVATDDTVVVTEDGETFIDPLVNDQGAGLHLHSVSEPENGEASLEGGRIRYRPEPDFFGRDRFTYIAEDLNGNRATATVDVIVEAVNDPPEVTGERLVLEENGQGEIDVLANDRDKEGDPLALVEVSTPLHGSVVLIGEGALLYTPFPGFDGKDRFSYTVVDSAGARADGVVEIVVEGKNDPPVVRNDRFAVKEGDTVALDLLANDRDPEGAPLRLEVVASPRRGKLDAALNYVAPEGYNGYDEITYRVIDPQGASTEGKGFITVYERLEPGAPIVQLPRASLEAEELAIIVNDNDPVSKAIGPYYARQRGIPEGNVIHVSLPIDTDTISPEQFAPILERVETRLPEGVQGYVLTWIRPFRVGCMSITSAFALGGYSSRYCHSGRGCSLTAPVDYFGSVSTRPFDDHGIRPAMVLGGVDETEVKALIERGVAADGTFPSGTGYLVRTTDPLRSVRYPDFESAVSTWNHDGGVRLEYRDNSDGTEGNLIENRNDVLFYFTGLTWVGGIDTNTYLPGAVADHLTSAGGVLTATSGQMSVLRWLEAGVTASYGAVVEPCNYPSKFPRVSTLLSFYFRGNTLLEAYWKSVQRPGEGIFVGEPLARPWGRAFLRYVNGALILKTTGLVPGKHYAILASDSPEGPFEPVVADITVDDHRLTEIVVPNAGQKFYRLVERES